MSLTLPIVAVVGATGNQGGSVVRHLSATGKYQIRALTRDPKKPSDLSKLPNVTLAAFDYNKPDTVDEVFKGAYAVFAVTNFVDPAILANHQLEIDHGKAMVDAAVKNGVKYFVWSTLPPCNEISNGKYKLPHFDNKAEVAKYARSQQSLKCLFVHAPCYFQNFDNIIQPSQDGYVISLPMKDTVPLDYIDIRDLGKVVAVMLESPDKYVNRDIVASAGQTTGKELAEAFTRVSGKTTTYTEITPEQYCKHLPPSLGPELAAMFQFYSDYGYCGDRYDTSLARNELGIKFATLEDWISQSKFAAK